MKTFLLAMDQALSAWDTFYFRARNVFYKGVAWFKRACYRPHFADLGHPGYLPYREHQILKAIDKNVFGSTKLPENYGQSLDERIVEYPWIFSRLSPGPGRLLDAGSVLNFDALLRKPIFSNKQVFISTLAPETQSAWWRKISYTYEDLRSASYKDDYFDWIVCLSTIEHVGMDTSVYTKGETNSELRPHDALVFLKELHRVLKPGGTLFLSFPFGKRSIQDSLQIFDQKGTEELVAAFHPRMEIQNFYRHTQKGWRACSAEQAADAGGFWNNPQPNPTRTVAAEAVACLELVK